MTTGIDPQSSVRAILAAHPAARAVLERSGLMGCGGEAGPDEPLAFFAQVHHIPIEQLLSELEAATALPPPDAAPANVRTVETAATPFDTTHRYPPFLIAALVLTLTGGATLGMFNLARLTTTLFGSLPRPSVWAHGYVQVFGFVSLFVMGIAYHVVPRFVAAPLHAPSLVVWTLGLQIAGVLAVASAFLAGTEVAPIWWRVGALFLLAASVLFARSIAGTLRAGRQGAEPFERWLAAGVIWLVIASALAVTAAFAGDIAWHRVLWPAALFGFAGSWIFGVGRRIFPVFLGWRTAAPALERPAFLLYQLGVAAWSAGAWPGGVATETIRMLGAVALLVAVPGYAYTLGLFSRRGAGGDHDRGYVPYVYAAWAWLAIGLALGPGWLAAATLAGGSESVTMLDFAAHAVALGFVAQMMMGVATRILPVFTGNPLWSPLARRATFWLLNGALGIRALQAVVAAGGWPSAWPLIALSGPPAVAATALFAGNVLLTISGARTSPRTTAVAREVEDRLVADVLLIPGALDVLVRAGFTPLLQPALRTTLARTVTLRQACRLRGIALEPLAAELRAREPVAQRPRVIPLRVST
jgi:hypothetical protein